MTNYEKIKNMSAEEMAEFLNLCPVVYEGKSKVKQWLEMEADDGNI